MAQLRNGEPDGRAIIPGHQWFALANPAIDRH
jgi:hypothetical protein